MHSIKRVNLNRYFAFTALTTLCAMLFHRNINDIYGILIIYVGTILNHFLLLETVICIIRMAKGKSVDKLALMIMFFGKFVVLISVIYLGWHFMDDRVFIPMLNYLIQIFILFLCLDRKLEV